MASSSSRSPHYGDEIFGPDEQDEEFEEGEEEEDEEEEDGIRKTDDTPRPARLKDSELQGYADLLGEQMVREKLTKALKIYDLEALRQALDEFDELDLERDGVYEHAKAVDVDVSSYRKLLREARHAKKPDPGLIQDRMTAVKRNKLGMYLREEMDKCELMVKRLSVKEKKVAILAMDKKTMAEMKSYSKPSALVHRIMTAALLLLGEDEDTTSRWPKVQSLCNPDGREGMVRRMMNFDPRDVHPDIASRAQYLIKDISLSQAQKASPGAATFYVWTKRVIGDDPDDDITTETDREGSHKRGSRPGEDPETDDRGRQKDDDYDDDDVSTFDEEDDYERREREAERKKQDLIYYKTTLQNWIHKEKRIFAQQKKKKEEVKRAAAAPKPRPAPNQVPTKPKASNLRYL